MILLVVDDMPAAKEIAGTLSIVSDVRTQS